MKRWQQLLSCYLALCVAFAGAVGLSPMLHVMVEHGGHGHLHSHAVFQTGGHGEVAHVHPHPHPHDTSNSDDPLARIFAEKYPQPKLFGLDLNDLYHAIGGWVARAFEHQTDSPSGDGEGHTHHSLAQMLLSGTVEGISDVPLLVCVPTLFTISSEVFPASFVASDFEAQTASRAPPVRI